MLCLRETNILKDLIRDNNFIMISSNLLKVFFWKEEKG